MKLNFGLVVGGLVVAALGVGVLGSGGVASAERPHPPPPPPVAGPPPVAPVAFVEDDFLLRPWLRRSIIECAAKVMDLEVWQVVYGLREGHSLKEIGVRAGVRPERLEYGILRCERAVLAHMVETGQLQPEEARRIYNFLDNNIERIISFHWNPDDEALN
jgi:hypothetical protein